MSDQEAPFASFVPSGEPPAEPRERRGEERQRQGQSASNRRKPRRSRKCGKHESQASLAS